MDTHRLRLLGGRVHFALLLLVAIGSPSGVNAALVSYQTLLNGANEAPPNASPGVGAATVEIDAVAHTMHVVVVFSGLTGLTTAAHIHAPTAAVGTGTAGVATMTPTFVGFPLGVTAGNYDMTFDMTLASSYNASYITANGGSPASAEAALFQAIADGKAYLNIHSTQFPGGEIRGFLEPTAPTPVEDRSWGRVKALYR